MQSPKSDDGLAPYWSLSGFRDGVIMMLPSLPGVVVFGLAFGALAAQKGLTLFDTTLMSAVVFAAVSQFVAMEVWTPVLTLSTILSLAIVTAVVNMRMLLMGASLRSWLSPLPAWQSYPTLFILTDANWLAATRYRREGGADVSLLFGGGLIIWLTWVPSTSIGHLFGSLIAEPKRYAIDLILPIYFVAMLVPLWRGPRRAAPWAIAGGTALLVQYLVPGFWFIIAGTLAGAISGGFLDDRD